MVDLIYCATPARLVRNDPSIKERIMRAVSSEGYAPFHPFQAFPYELFEGNLFVGREWTLRYCEKAIEICDRFLMFGISEGTLREARHAQYLAKPMALHFQFDPEWRKFYAELGGTYGHVLDDLIAATYGS